ncbi:hypothetical protein ABR737_01365 [Streptomyces sp. Edi2]|uniref:hypothetical protein n=1 Tax=Streptomyces sp. Edi2 TaxID=3162528 RepID=UPI00330626E2
MRLRPDTAFDAAAARAEAGADPTAYLLAYASGRSRAQQGGDIEADWLLLTTRSETSAAVLAGFIEGLASTRSWVEDGEGR